MAASSKKYVQPRNSCKKYPLTSDGRRTYVVMGGQPVALSCDATPCSSAGVSAANTPRGVQASLLHKSLLTSQALGGGGSADLAAALLPARSGRR